VSGSRTLRSCGNGSYGSLERAPAGQSLPLSSGSTQARWDNARPGIPRRDPRRGVYGAGRCALATWKRLAREKAIR
jgi:hypothetical protein